MRSLSLLSLSLLLLLLLASSSDVTTRMVMGLKREADVDVCAEDEAAHVPDGLTVAVGIRLAFMLGFPVWFRQRTLRGPVGVGVGGMMDVIVCGEKKEND